MGTTINKKETGINLRRLMDERNLSVKDVQEHLQLNSVQSIYHWLNGISLPSLANAYALSALFEVPMDDIIIGNKKPAASKEFIPKTAEERRWYQYYIKLEECAA